MKNRIAVKRHCPTCQDAAHRQHAVRQDDGSRRARLDRARFDRARWVIAWIVSSIVWGVVTQSASADMQSVVGQLLDPPAANPPEAVVRVYAKEDGALASGSGSLIYVDDRYGYVLTNWHVVRDAVGGEVITRFPNGFESAATILKMDERWDLALLRIWKPNVAPMPLSSTVPTLGEDLTIMGYGSGKFRAARGRCKYYASPDNRSPSEMIEISVAARQGDSGGPMVNQRGELAAVLFGAGRGVTTGTHIGRVVHFLNSIDLSSSPDVPQVAEQSPSQDFSSAADSLVQQQPDPFSDLHDPTDAYELPPLEWSTIDDHSKVVAAAAQEQTNQPQLVAFRPKPPVTEQMDQSTTKLASANAPRHILTIEPYEPDPTAPPNANFSGDGNLQGGDAVGLEVTLPQGMTQSRTGPTPRSARSRTDIDAMTSAGGEGWGAQPAAAHGVYNPLSPVDVRATAGSVPRPATNTQPYLPRFARQSEIPYGATSFNADYLGARSQRAMGQQPSSSSGLRKLVSIAQTILAIVGIVTLIEKFRS